MKTIAHKLEVSTATTLNGWHQKLHVSQLIHKQLLTFPVLWNRDHSPRRRGQHSHHPEWLAKYTRVSQLTHMNSSSLTFTVLWYGDYSLQRRGQHSHHPEWPAKCVHVSQLYVINS